MEKLYRDTSLVGAASLLAISAVYFAELAVPKGLLLLTVPASFGLTAYLSREGFNKAVVASLVAVPFAILGPKMAVAALVVSLGNVFVSVFGGGERFRDYYASTRLPLLFVGLIIGAGVFASIQVDPEIENQVRTTASDAFASQVGQTVEDMGLVDSRTDQQVRIVEQTSRNAIRSTQAYVLNDLQQNLSNEEWLMVSRSLDDARQEIPEQMANATDQALQQNSLNITSSMRSMVETKLTGKRMVVVIPLAVTLMLGLQPVTGLITALTAFIARRIDPN